MHLGFKASWLEAFGELFTSRGLSFETRLTSSANRISGLIFRFLLAH